MESQEIQCVTKRSSHASKIDHQRELKDLISQLEQTGYRVRREQLKQGFGWKTVSGTCRLNADKLILVDRRLPIEEQLVFLRSMLLQLQN